MANEDLQYTIERVELGATKLNALSDARLSSNLNRIIISGAVDQTHSAVGGARPQAEFTTTMIKTLLGKVGFGAFTISGASNFTLLLAKMGATAARNKAVKAACSAGLVVPVSLTASRMDAAQISAVATLISTDGVSSPVSISSDQALVPDKSWTKDVYALKSVSLGGTDIPDIQSVTINFGIIVDVLDGNVYPIAASIISRNPNITLNFTDAAVASTLGLAGKVYSANTIITLSPMADSAPRDGTDITFTSGASAVHWDSLGGARGSRAAISAVLTPLHDGTNDPIAISGLS